MIFTFFTISTIYILTVTLCAHYTGLPTLPFAKTRGLCQLGQDKIFFIEVAIFGVSLYLNLLLGILTATGDSAFFVSITKRFAESESPFSGFYASGGITYPPLFNYIYYMIAKIMQMLHIPFDYTSEKFILAVKSPGILCEFLMAWLLYRTAKEHLKKGQSIPVLLLTLLNPAYLFVTAYICQIDALYVFFMLLTVLLINKKHLKTSYFAFAAAVLCKFQAIFITPVLVYAIINEVFLHDFNWKKFWVQLAAGLAAIFCMFVSYLPFVWDRASGTYYQGGVLINFKRSVSGYGWASQNTYNFWNLFGYNFRPETLYFGPFACSTWGAMFIVLLVLFCSVLFWKKKSDASIYPMLGALLVSGTVFFSTKMMPRYLYPAVPLLIFGFILKPNSKRFCCTLGFTISFFLLTTFDYVVYPRHLYAPTLILPKIISLYFLACFIFLINTIFTE